MNSAGRTTGFRWPVSVSREIEAPAERVWEVISRPGNLELCHPFCARNPVHAWPGPDSRDAVHYLSGWVYERQFHNWIDGAGYDLEIGRPGGGKSYVSWRIAPLDERRCTLTITVYPEILQRIPVVLRWLPHYFRLRPLLQQYLESVLGGFDWYLQHGEPVPRNHFGKHPWFSAAAKAE